MSVKSDQSPNQCDATVQPNKTVIAMVTSLHQLDWNGIKACRIVFCTKIHKHEVSGESLVGQADRQWSTPTGSSDAEPITCLKLPIPSVSHLGMRPEPNGRSRGGNSAAACLLKSTQHQWKKHRMPAATQDPDPLSGCQQLRASRDHSPPSVNHL